MHPMCSLLVVAFEFSSRWIRLLSFDRQMVIEPETDESYCYKCSYTEYATIIIIQVWSMVIGYVCFVDVG